MMLSLHDDTLAEEQEVNTIAYDNQKKNTMVSVQANGWTHSLLNYMGPKSFGRHTSNTNALLHAMCAGFTIMF